MFDLLGGICLFVSIWTTSQPDNSVVLKSFLVSYLCCQAQEETIAKDCSGAPSVLLGCPHEVIFPKQNLHSLFSTQGLMQQGRFAIWANYCIVSLVFLVFSFSLVLVLFNFCFFMIDSMKTAHSVWENLD